MPAPYGILTQHALESVQTFTCKNATKQWSSDYQQLLEALWQSIELNVSCTISCMITVTFHEVFWRRVQD